MRDELYEEMFEMEQRHWWFAAKHRIVEHLLARMLPPPPPGQRHKIADLGCGCGMLLYRLKDRYEVVGVDGSPKAIEFCALRDVPVKLGDFPQNIPLEPDTYDAVLLLDVLEHLDRDVETAQAASKLLKPGGILMCTVPAYQWLWSPRDEHHQHFRRYSAQRFRDLMNATQLKLELVSFFNTALFPLAAAARLAAKLRRSDGMKDLRVPPQPINATLATVFASERHLLGRAPLPFGLSLIGVARKL
jgi:SAM-dependent methyltransferase